MTSNLQAKRADHHLDSFVRFNGSVMSKREMCDQLAAMGAKPESHEVPAIKPMSRRAYFRASNRDQRAHDERMQRAGMKTEYRAILADGTFWMITKIQYDLMTA